MSAATSCRATAACTIPAVNLELGQRYVLLLAGQDAIDGDLLRLLASYNAGPGGVSALGRDDPRR